MFVTMPLTFVTGPVRSGKSRFAASLAANNPGPVQYVATAKRDDADAEWKTRLAHHVANRPEEWQTVETAEWPEARICGLFANAERDSVLLVDSLGGWLDAQIAREIDRIEADYAAIERDLDDAAAALAGAMLASAASVIVVGDEVGWGIVPLAPSARLFRDVLGRMQQRLAANAREAFLVVSGYAIDLRVAGRREP